MKQGTRTMRTLGNLFKIRFVCVPIYITSLPPVPAFCGLQTLFSSSLLSYLYGFVPCRTGFCNRLTVIGLHSRFISTVSDKLKLNILIFVRYNKSDNAAVFPHLIIGLLDCTAQVSGFIAVFRGGSFGKGIPHTFTAV